MRAYKRMSKAATMALFTASMMSVGGAATVGAQQHPPSLVNTSANSSHERDFVSNDEDRFKNAVS